MDDKIINNERIGQYILGMNVDALKSILTENYSVEKRTKCDVLIAENFMFWVDESNNSVSQITAFNMFKGKFLNKIGIGSTLKDIKEEIDDYKEDLDVYILPKYPGICFELKDEDDWDELSSHIEYITIYKESRVTV
jgi:hypothetical protein